MQFDSVDGSVPGRDDEGDGGRLPATAGQPRPRQPGLVRALPSTCCPPNSASAGFRPTTPRSSWPRPGLRGMALSHRVVRDPDATAIITSTTSLSYLELYQQAVQACRLVALARTWAGDELVGLAMTRGPRTDRRRSWACMLAGAAYLPIDAGLPVERQRYMLRDGRVRCLLTNVEQLEVPDRIEGIPAAGRPAGRPAVPAIRAATGPQPGRPRLRALHLGHHRRAEGRDGQPAQRGQPGRRLPAPVRRSARPIGSSASAHSTSTCRSGTFSARCRQVLRSCCLTTTGQLTRTTGSNCASGPGSRCGTRCRPSWRCCAMN